MKADAAAAAAWFLHSVPVGQEAQMDYSCYSSHHLAPVMSSSELKQGHKLKNGPVQSQKGHGARSGQYY